MSETSPLIAGDALLTELTTGPAYKAPEARIGKLKRCHYTHQAMVELIIEHPELDQNEIAAHFGYTPQWISNILASDAFQEQLEGRRNEVIDPVLKANLKERFQALARASVDVLMRKLEQPQVSDMLAVKAGELAAKALKLGESAPPPQDTSAERLERLAHRLINLQENRIEKDITPRDLTLSAG
jgi:hypothetical protein